MFFFSDTTMGWKDTKETIVDGDDKNRIRNGTAVYKYKRLKLKCDLLFSRFSRVFFSLFFSSSFHLFPGAFLCYVTLFVNPFILPNFRSFLLNPFNKWPIFSQRALDFKPQYFPSSIKLCYCMSRNKRMLLVTLTIPSYSSRIYGGICDETCFLLSWVKVCLKPTSKCYSV